MEMTTKPPIRLDAPASRPTDDAAARRKALETLRRNLLSAAKQVEVLQAIEDRKETAA